MYWAGGCGELFRIENLGCKDNRVWGRGLGGAFLGLCVLGSIWAGEGIGYGAGAFGAPFWASEYYGPSGLVRQSVMAPAPLGSLFGLLRITDHLVWCVHR